MHAPSRSISLTFVYGGAAAGAPVINFGPGTGTLSGSFVYNASTNTFVSWDIAVSAGLDTAGNPFSALVYSNTVAGSVGGPGGFNGAGFSDFSFFSPTGGNGFLPGRTLSFVVPGVSGSSIAGLPGPGETSQITLVTLDGPLAGSAGCLGLPAVDAIPCGAEGQSSGSRYLMQPAYLSVTDPLAFTRSPLRLLPLPPQNLRHFYFWAVG